MPLLRPEGKTHRLGQISRVLIGICLTVNHWCVSSYVYHSSGLAYLSLFGDHVSEKIGNPVGIPPLVVVPGDDFEKSFFPF